jgi:hypothetical protein
MRSPKRMVEKRKMVSSKYTQYSCFHGGVIFCWMNTDQVTVSPYAPQHTTLFWRIQDCSLPQIPSGLEVINSDFTNQLITIPLVGFLIPSVLFLPSSFFLSISPSSLSLPLSLPSSLLSVYLFNCS